MIKWGMEGLNVPKVTHLGSSTWSSSPTPGQSSNNHAALSPWNSSEESWTHGWETLEFQHPAWDCPGWNLRLLPPWESKDQEQRPWWMKADKPYSNWAVQGPLPPSPGSRLQGQDVGCARVSALLRPALNCFIKRKCLPGLLLAGLNGSLLGLHLERKLLLVYKKAL